MAAGCRLLRGGGAAVSILLPTLAAFVLPPAPVGAAPSLTMWVDSTRAALGTPIGLTIRLRYEQGAASRVPDLSTLIKDALVRPLASEPELVGVGQVEVDLRYDLRFYQLGHQRIPEIEVVFTRSAGDTSIRTAGPVEVEIVAVREVDDIELRDIKPPVAVPGGIPVWLAVVVVLVALIVAAGLIWRSRRRPGVGHALPPPALPVEYAAEFTRIAAMGLLERGAFKVYYSLLSQTLRRFLEQRCPGLAAVEQTTEEIARAVEAFEISPETVQEISDFLGAADLVKFAHAEPSLESARQASDVGVRIVAALIAGTDPTVGSCDRRLAGD